jgi:predicted SPOUT superfamily RNA methylase MTH1
MSPLSKPTHTRSQPVVKGTVKTGLTVDLSECRPELLPRSPNLTYISKSTFMKVVHLVEGRNFHVDWHFKF